MTKEILEVPELVGSSLGLYDSGAADEPTVYAEKVIDVTALCEDAEQVIVKYARVVNGTIAQICNLYDKGKDLGANVHYNVNNMTWMGLSSDAVFNRFCRIVQATPSVLANVIFENKPERAEHLNN